MFFSQRIDKENVVDLHHGHSTVKKNILNFAGKLMQPEDIILSNITQPPKYKCGVHSSIITY